MCIRDRVSIAGQAGVTLLGFGLRLRLLDQLFRLFEALERHFGFDDAGPYENIAVFIPDTPAVHGGGM